MPRVTLHAVAAAMLLAASPLPSISDTYTVRQNGSGHFTTIQAAVAFCREGDTVLVGAGTYVPPRWGIDPDGLNLTIISEGGPGVTTVDATGQERGFHYQTLEGSSSRIEGFTIRGAEDAGLRCFWASPTVVNCRFIENARGLSTGPESSVSLFDCEFIDNAGLAASISGYVSLTVSNCTFEGNGGAGLYLSRALDATVTGCSFSGNGGRGLELNYETTVSITNCTFTENAGGLSCEESWPTVSDCSFEDNHVDEYGGALNCSEGSAATFVDCHMQGNTAEFGGAVYSIESSATFSGCTFVGNESTYLGGAVCASRSDSFSFTECIFYDNASYRGGAVLCYWSSPTLERCTIAGNRAEDSGAITCLSEGNPLVSHCVIAFNSDGAPVFCQGGDATVQNSMVFGNTGGDSLCSWTRDVVFEDPLFCDFNAGDLTLCANSPCLPDNNGWGTQVGALGQGCADCDSPVEATSWGAIKAMYR